MRLGQIPRASFFGGALCIASCFGFALSLALLLAGNALESLALLSFLLLPSLLCFAFLPLPHL
jgi:hypothetical protein